MLWFKALLVLIFALFAASSSFSSATLPSKKHPVQVVLPDSIIHLGRTAQILLPDVTLKTSFDLLSLPLMQAGQYIEPQINLYEAAPLQLIRGGCHLWLREQGELKWHYCYLQSTAASGESLSRLITLPQLAEYALLIGPQQSIFYYSPPSVSQLAAITAENSAEPSPKTTLAELIAETNFQFNPPNCSPGASSVALDDKDTEEKTEKLPIGIHEAVNAPLEPSSAVFASSPAFSPQIFRLLLWELWWLNGLAGLGIYDFSTTQYFLNYSVLSNKLSVLRARFPSFQRGSTWRSKISACLKES